MTTHQPPTPNHDTRLAFMLKLQLDLQKRYTPFGKAPADLDPGDKMEYIRTQILALTDELHEAMAETGWKPWASSNHINVEAFKGELVDAWHFFMNLMLSVGMTSEELFQAYVGKNAVNHLRQDQGYDGVSTKCPGCKRAYDDKATLCQGPRESTIKAEGVPAFCGSIARYVSSAGIPMTLVGGTGWVEEVAA